MGPMMTDQQLNGRHGTHADIENAAAAREQARDNCLFDHFPRGARIATDDDRARADIGAEGLRKTRQQGWRQRLANHSAYTGDADFESWYRSHDLLFWDRIYKIYTMRKGKSELV